MTLKEAIDLVLCHTLHCLNTGAGLLTSMFESCSRIRDRRQYTSLVL